MKAKYTPITNAEFERVARETKERDLMEPRIGSAAYDASTRMLYLEMRNGVDVNIPIDVLFDGFEEAVGATPAQLSACVIRENGASLHWDELDVQMETISILQEAFKLRTVAANARRAGRVSTPAKAAAARRNGAKGGRPRKGVAA